MADLFFSPCTGCGGSRGVIFWHNSILSLMNLTSALSLSLAFRFISLGDVFR
ncbi:hypothetical protein GYM33_002830 [Escherichia coli]|nr:hypothetical protein [Escherichia coli]